MRKAAILPAGILVVLVLATVARTGKDTGHRFLNLPGRGNDLPFSHAVMAGETLYVSGGLGLDPETGRPPDDVEQEARLVMDGLRRKLQLAGMEMDDLVQVQVFCPDLTLYDRFNAVYQTYFKDRYPARAFIGSGPLLRGARFEVMGTAVKRR